MRLSELRKLVREVMREAVIDKDGLERAGSSLPQTVEFDPEELDEVNTLVGGFGLSAIAEKFGVSRSCILSINLGKTWSYINV